MDCGFGLPNQDRWGCAATRFEGDYTLTEWSILQWKWVERDYTYVSDTQNCALDAVCEHWAGGENSCMYSEYEYQKWVPTSCNVSADYDAWTESYSTKSTTACCDDSDYCNEDASFDDCPRDADLGMLISEWNDCWDAVKREFMSELLCDESGQPLREALAFSKNCTEDDGSWKSKMRSTPICAYRPRCTEKLRQLLTDFGECSCIQTAYTNFTGSFISTIMQANWQQFCPNIELSCGWDQVAKKAVIAGTKLAVKIGYRLLKMRYTYIVFAAETLITSTILNTMRINIATALNLDFLAFNLSISTRRRRRNLLSDQTAIELEVRAEDNATAEYIETMLDASLAQDIAEEIGYDVNFDDLETEEVLEETEGSGTYIVGTTESEEDSKEGNNAASLFLAMLWSWVAVAVWSIV